MSVSVDELTLLADTLKGLTTLQLVVFVSAITQVGLFVVVLLILKNNNSNNKFDNDTNKSTFTMMSQIYNSFSSTTESFKMQQEKDWQRTQQFFKAFNELFRIQKQIYYVIGRLEKRIESIESIVNKDANNGT